MIVGVSGGPLGLDFGHLGVPGRSLGADFDHFRLPRKASGGKICDFAIQFLFLFRKGEDGGNLEPPRRNIPEQI